MFYGRDARAEAGSGAHATLSIAAARTEEGGVNMSWLGAGALLILTDSI